MCLSGPQPGPEVMLSAICTLLSLPEAMLLRLPERSFENCPWILSLCCLKPDSGFLYFFRIKSSLVSAALSHPTFPVSLLPCAHKEPKCFPATGPLHFCSPCLECCLSINPSNCSSVSFPGFQLKYHLLKEVLTAIPSPLHLLPKPV